MYEKILRDPLLFPDEVSPPARSILTGLLTRDPAQRLGVNGADEIKRHPFFDKIDWRRLAQKKIQPPFKPSVCSPVDVSNFDTVFTTEQPLDSVVEGSQLSQTVQAQFEGACPVPVPVPVSRVFGSKGKETRADLPHPCLCFPCRLLVQRARNHRACGLRDRSSSPFLTYYHHLSHCYSLSSVSLCRHIWPWLRIFPFAPAPLSQGSTLNPFLLHMPLVV